jgi:hypothetical protein
MLQHPVVNWSTWKVCPITVFEKKCIISSECLNGVMMQEHLPHQASQRGRQWTAGRAPAQILKSPWKLLRDLK